MEAFLTELEDEVSNCWFVLPLWTCGWFLPYRGIAATVNKAVRVPFRRSPCSWRRPFILLHWRHRLIFVCSSIRHKGNELLEDHNFVYHPQNWGHAFGETSASWSNDSSSTEGGSSDLSCKPGLGTFRALDTMTVLTSVSTRRRARTARALLCQLRSAQLHLVHKSFPKFLSNRIHLTLHTKFISLNIKRNQAKIPTKTRQIPCGGSHIEPPYILSPQSLLIWG